VLAGLVRVGVGVKGRRPPLRGDLVLAWLLRWGKVVVIGQRHASRDAYEERGDLVVVTCTVHRYNRSGWLTIYKAGEQGKIAELTTGQGGKYLAVFEGDVGLVVAHGFFLLFAKLR